MSSGCPEESRTGKVITKRKWDSGLASGSDGIFHVGEPKIRKTEASKKEGSSFSNASKRVSDEEILSHFENVSALPQYFTASELRARKEEAPRGNRARKKTIQLNTALPEGFTYSKGDGLVAGAPVADDLRPNLAKKKRQLVENKISSRAGPLGQLPFAHSSDCRGGSETAWQNYPGIRKQLTESRGPLENTFVTVSGDVSEFMLAKSEQQQPDCIETSVTRQNAVAPLETRVAIKTDYTYQDSLSVAGIPPYFLSVVWGRIRFWIHNFAALHGLKEPPKMRLTDVPKAQKGNITTGNLGKSHDILEFTTENKISMNKLLPLMHKYPDKVEHLLGRQSLRKLKQMDLAFEQRNERINSVSNLHKTLVEDCDADMEKLKDSIGHPLLRQGPAAVLGHVGTITDAAGVHRVRLRAPAGVENENFDSRIVSFLVDECREANAKKNLVKIKYLEDRNDKIFGDTEVKDAAIGADVARVLYGARDGVDEHVGTGGVVSENHDVPRDDELEFKTANSLTNHPREEQEHIERDGDCDLDALFAAGTVEEDYMACTNTMASVSKKALGIQRKKAPKMRGLAEEQFTREDIRNHVIEPVATSSSKKGMLAKNNFNVGNLIYTRGPVGEAHRASAPSSAERLGLPRSLQSGQSVSVRADEPQPNKMSHLNRENAIASSSGPVFRKETLAVISLPVSSVPSNEDVHLSVEMIETGENSAESCDNLDDMFA